MSITQKHLSIDALSASVPSPHYILPVSFVAERALSKGSSHFIPEAKMLISVLVWKQMVGEVDRRGYSNLHSHWLKRLLGRNYATVTGELLASGTIGQKNYSAGRRAKGYRLTTQFAREGIIQEQVESKRIVNRLMKWWKKQQLEQQDRWLSIHHILDRRQRLIVIDRDMALSKLMSDSVKTPSGTGCTLAQSALIETIATHGHRLTLGSASERVTTSCGLLKRTIRHSALTVGGKQLVEVDLKGSQPTLLALLLRMAADVDNDITPAARCLTHGTDFPPFQDLGSRDCRDYIDTVQNDDIYDRIRAELPDPPKRRQVKHQTMCNVIGKRGNYPVKNVEYAFRKLWPSVYRYVRKVNQCDHKRLLIILQTMESRLVTQSACVLFAERLPADIGFVPIHDCLLVPEGYQEMATTVFSDLSTQIGFRLTTEVKRSTGGGRAEEA
jgi:hypothetical protein